MGVDAGTGRAVAAAVADRVPACVAEGGQMPGAGILRADNHREGIVETQGIEPLQAQLAIVLPQLIQNPRRIGDRLVLHDVGESRTGVLGIEIDFLGEERLLGEHRSAQAQFALDRLVKPGLYMLGDDFAEDGLLSEVLGSNG